ncbi:MAG: InlB B-repeat-containing protein [Clostridia bacterium]|nr:InlB B-repeat-containing protein [Clostridia bacterium]
MKKIFIWAATAAVALGMGIAALPEQEQSYQTASASATENGVLNANGYYFEDDFESYSSYGASGATNAGTDPSNMKYNWGNMWFDGIGDGKYDASSGNTQAEIATVNGNKVLKLNTATNNESFFHLTPRATSGGDKLVLTNYEVSFRFYILPTSTGCESSVAPWISILNRKVAQQSDGTYAPKEGWFNSTTSVMMATRAGIRDGEVGISPYYYSELNYCNNNAAATTPENEDRTGAAEDMKVSTVYNTWHEYKCVVNGDLMDLYLDGVHLGGLTLGSAKSFAKYKLPGYISLACCVWDGYVDDFKVAPVTNDYTIKAEKNIDAAGTVSVSNDGKVAEDSGESITLTATTNYGYTFLGWYDAAGNEMSTEEEWTFAPTASGKYTAKWSINKYTVTSSMNLPAAGTIANTSKGEPVEYGTKVTLTATTNEGYTWDGWYYGGQKQESGAQQIVVSADADKEYVATWTSNECTVSTSKNIADAGTVKIDGTDATSKTVDFNTPMTLTATTNEGYTFLGWYDGVNQVCATETFTFNAQATKTYEARWKKNTYLIKLSTNYGRATGAKTYEHGATVTVKAIPTTTSYDFLGWYNKADVPADPVTVDTAKALSTTETWSFTATEAKELVAVWDIDFTTYKVTLTNDLAAAGTVSGNGLTKNDETGALEGSIEENSSITLIAAPNNGYNFDGWYENGVKIEGATGTTYTFEVTADRNITAKWSPIEYTIKVESNNADAGNVEIVGEDGLEATISYGGSITLKATANKGYTFLGWYNGNVRVWAEATYTFNPDAAKTYTAKWEVNECAVTVSSNMSEAGSVSVSPDKTLFIEGDVVTLTATANAGYRFLGWYDGSVLLSDGAEYTFEVSKDMTIEAQWTVQPVLKTTTVQYGESAKVALVAGAAVLSIKKDGEEIPSAAVSYDVTTGILEFDPQYIKDNANEVGSVELLFEVKTDMSLYDVKVIVSGGRTLTKKVNPGQTITVTLAAGAKISTIVLNEEEIARKAVSYTDTDGKLTFDAVFLQELNLGSNELTVYTDKGTFTVKLNVKEASAEGAGCGGVVGVSSATTLLGLASAALVASKRRKKK